MGRILRRVPLDFDWPLKKVWRGFINPHFKPCPAAVDGKCRNGTTNAGMWMDSICRLLALIGQESSMPQGQREHARSRGRIYPHPDLEGWQLAPRAEMPAVVVDRLNKIDDKDERFRQFYAYHQLNPPKILELDSELAGMIKGLAGGLEPDVFNGGSVQYAIQISLLKAAGVEDLRWGTCKVCNGHCVDPDIREAYEAWSSEAPPEGEGWQLWETVSDGSPVSPVLATREEFVCYLIDEGYSPKAAEAFTESGWAPSFAGVRDSDGNEALVTGIEAHAHHSAEDDPS